MPQFYDQDDDDTPGILGHYGDDARRVLDATYPPLTVTDPEGDTVLHVRDDGVVDGIAHVLMLSAGDACGPEWVIGN
jgi:hypothetical protein